MRALCRPQGRLWKRGRNLRTRASRMRSVVVDGGSPSEKKVCLSTPLFYVNAPPHLGGAYTAMATDACARHARRCGMDVLMVTGTDEHGEKIARAAETAGQPPQQHCDQVVKQYRQLWEMLDVKYDRFVRTTEKKHEKMVQDAVQKVWDQGDVYKSSYRGKYCVGCEEYKDEKELEEGDLCPLHKTVCEDREEENYFFRLSKYEKDIQQLVDSKDFVQPEYRKNEVSQWVSQGVRDFSISRAAVEWGIPMKQDPSQTLYVWFDALLGYVSALLEPEDEPTLENALQKGYFPYNVHIIGKDILRFHAVYWPGMLMSMGLPLPRMVFGHGFLTKDGLKMSKSLGNTLDPQRLVSLYGSDAVRYYFLREFEFGRDGDFQHDRFINIVNAGLANDLGNLLNRSLNLLKKNCSSELPLSSADIVTEHPLRLETEASVRRAHEAFEHLRFNEVCAAAAALSGHGNQYIDEVAPWKLLKSKDPEDIAKAHVCLVSILESLRILAVILYPITPRLAQKVYVQLGIDDDVSGSNWDDATKWGTLLQGHRLPKPVPVFARLEEQSLEEKESSVVA